MKPTQLALALAAIYGRRPREAIWMSVRVYIGAGGPFSTLQRKEKARAQAEPA